MRIAIMDDWQGVARSSADWSAVEVRAELAVYAEPFANEDAAAAALADFDILLPSSMARACRISWRSSTARPPAS